MTKALDNKLIIDADLIKMSDSWKAEWKSLYGRETLAVLDGLLDLLNRGGKRMRGALAMESYYLHGGTDKKVALGAARVIELVQAYLLAIDDIQDESELRRGGPALHVALAGQKGRHYGTAQALNAALLAAHRSVEELTALPVKDSDKIQALQLLNQNISVTITGQASDIYNQAALHVSDKSIIRTMTWKTAYYTFISPLELGACLAGRKGLSERLKNYALHAGVAFQISDDIIGVFGQSDVAGKSPNDDIREGKATLLSTYARQHADPAQLKTLTDILGKRNASAKQCDKVRAVFEATGAHRYAKKRAHDYARAAIMTLGKRPEPFLVSLVQYAISREL